MSGSRLHVKAVPLLFFLYTAGGKNPYFSRFVLVSTSLSWLCVWKARHSCREGKVCWKVFQTKYSQKCISLQMLKWNILLKVLFFNRVRGKCEHTGYLDTKCQVSEHDKDRWGFDKLHAESMVLRLVTVAINMNSIVYSIQHYKIESYKKKWNRL